MGSQRVGHNQSDSAHSLAYKAFLWSGPARFSSLIFFMLYKHLEVLFLASEKILEWQFGTIMSPLSLISSGLVDFYLPFITLFYN